MKHKKSTPPPYPPPNETHAQRSARLLDWPVRTLANPKKYIKTLEATCKKKN
jgi:hypothetical protein